MENWKKAVLVGSAGAAAILIAKRKRPAGFLAAGIGLVILAGEYPRAFDRIANLTPHGKIRHADHLFPTPSIRSATIRIITRYSANRGESLMSIATSGRSRAAVK